MGVLIYDNADPPISIDDRALWHLKTLILTKLRRGESFSVSWEHANPGNPGYTTIWLHPSIPLRFVFDSPERPALNRLWLVELNDSAIDHGGIVLTPEQIHPGAGNGTDESQSSPSSLRSRAT